MNKTLKNIASQLHLWLGILSGLVVFIVALTGSILVFEDELEPVLYPDFHVVNARPGEQRLPLDHLKTIMDWKYPKSPVTKIVIEPDMRRTILFTMQPGEDEKQTFTAAIDPYTGRITEVRDDHSAFFEVVLRLHRYLCLEETGKVITGISCIMFLTIMITGLVMWWPNRKNRKQRFRIKWEAKFKRLNWDLHAVFGFYVLPFIFLIAATGLVWSYKWVNTQIYVIFDGRPPEKREAPRVAALVPLDESNGNLLERIFAETHRQLPHLGKVTFTLPLKKDIAITVSKMDYEAGYDNVTSFYYFNPHNGTLVSKRTYDGETRGMKVRRLVYPIHTGRLWGWPTKIIAFIVALIAATLPVTGIMIWLGKKFKKPTVVRPVGARRVKAKLAAEE